MKYPKYSAFYRGSIFLILHKNLQFIYHSMCTKIYTNIALHINIICTDRIN